MQVASALGEFKRPYPNEAVLLMKYILVLICLYLPFSVQADIQDIREPDLKKIKYFFENLVDRHDFSYTIFGSKPMSLADFCLEVPSGLSPYRWIRSQFFTFKRRASLKTWYKYRDDFNLKDFIFLDEETDLISCLVLILINKKNMLRILHDHEPLFKEELGDSFTPESFLEKLEKRQISLAMAIHKSQKLLGIMLGYGERNATLFQERCDLQEEIEKRKKLNLSEDEALAVRLNAIESQSGCFSELDAEAVIHPIYFLADVSHPETVVLKQQYERERQRIVELRKKHDFMDHVLRRLIGI